MAMALSRKGWFIGIGQNEMGVTELFYFCRAPCHDDRCLIMTNRHAFPDVRLFLYQPAVNISESERIHDEYYNSDYFIAHPYSHAVDGNDNTAWRTLDSMY
jgi:hypothetical protein